MPASVQGTEMKKNSTDDPKSLAMFILAMVIFGTIGPLRRLIPLSSAMIVFFRGLIGSLFLLAYIKITNRPDDTKLDRRTWFALIRNGIFIGINWILLFEAYRYTTIARATLAYYLQPSIVLFLSPIVFKEKLTLQKGILGIVSLAGMVLVSGVLQKEPPSVNEFRGILYGIGAACFYAFVVITNKQIVMENAAKRTIIQLSSAAVLLVPYLLITEQGAQSAFTPTVIGLLLVAGIVHTGIAYLLYFSSISGLKAQTISILSYIDPVTALAVSALVLKEGMSVSAMIGAVMIISSAFLSSN